MSWIKQTENIDLRKHDNESCEQQTRPLETSRTAHIAAICFAMILPTAATLLYFVFLSGSELMQVVYFGSKVLQFSFPLLWVLAVQRHRIRILRPNWKSINAGLLMGMGIVATGLLAYYGFLKDSAYLANAPALITAKGKRNGFDDSSTLHRLRSLSGGTPFVIGRVLLALVCVWSDQTNHRTQDCDGDFKPGVHVPPRDRNSPVSRQGLGSNPLFFTVCAVGGGLWAWLYDRYKTLYGPWVSHLLVDLGIMYIGFDLAVFSN